MLYAITDSNLLPGETLFTAVEAAVKAGCDWIQYRDKSQDDEKRLYESTRLLQTCRTYNAKLIINDDANLAKKIGADGVHLGQNDGDAKEARCKLGSSAIIGITCHNSLDLAKKAIDDGASYIAFGRFFSSKTKPGASNASLDILQQASEKYPDITIVAIGGITTENAKIVLNAGADKIAVCHALFSSQDIGLQTKRFINL